MLYKNDEQYKLSPKEIEAVEKFFHNKFPVKVVYPAERIVPSKLKHNRKPDKPNSISFDLKAVVRTPSGTDVWRYADNMVIGEKGVRKYTPKKFLFNGSRPLKRNDIELIYFLLNKSEYCKGGTNEGPMVKFMFEDLVTEAEKRAEKKRIDQKLDGLIYGEEFGLQEDKLRAILGSLYNDVEAEKDLTLAQVQWRLDANIRASKNGIDDFFRLANSEEEIKTRMSITAAMKMGVLKHDLVKKVWFWQASGERGTTTICKIAPSKTPSEAIYEYYLISEEFREDLQAVLITKNPDAGKKGKGKKEEDDNKGEE